MDDDEPELKKIEIEFGDGSTLEAMGTVAPVNEQPKGMAMDGDEPIFQTLAATVMMELIEGVIKTNDGETDLEPGTYALTEDGIFLMADEEDEEIYES